MVAVGSEAFKLNYPFIHMEVSFCAYVFSIQKNSYDSAYLYIAVLVSFQSSDMILKIQKAKAQTDLTSVSARSIV